MRPPLRQVVHHECSFTATARLAPPTLRSAPLYAVADASSPKGVLFGDRIPAVTELRNCPNSGTAQTPLSVLFFTRLVASTRAPTATDVRRQHALLFTALGHPACDVRLPRSEARAVGALAHTLSSSVHAIQKASTNSCCTQTDASQFADHITLASVFIAAAQQPDATASAHDALRHLLGGHVTVPESVVARLLALPTSPTLLQELLHHLLRSPPLSQGVGRGAVDAMLFPVLMSALLNNDNFFAASETGSRFAEMDALLRDVVLRGVAQQAQSVGGFDYISIRWTPLMNKWARVYTKQNEGERLFDGFQYLIEAVPAAETKIPASFYVRLVGALIDRGQAEPSAHTLPANECGETMEAVLWAKVVTAGSRALRLYGRHTSELRALWIVLMKAALTLPGRDKHGAQRLLEAYLLCSHHGHPAPVDRAGVLQLMRLTSEAVLSGWPPFAVSGTTQEKLQACETTWIEPLCSFMEAYSSISFLWLLDGVGMVVSALWTAYGSPARPLAARLCENLEAFLQRNGVTGVSLSNNPALAAAMEHFEIGAPHAFWWTCGCGAVLASSSKRCVECLRKSGGSVWWSCSRCGEWQGQQLSAPGLHRCAETDGCHSCGAPHPRVDAAHRSDLSVCPQCADLLDVDGHCRRCHDVATRQAATTVCPDCETTHNANALYCPHCFRADPSKHLRIWLCEECMHFSLSTWSHCQTCAERGGGKRRRRTSALTAPFMPWRCGCGASNHPCRTVCPHCSRSGASSYTCPLCHTPSSLRVHEHLASANTPALDIHLCEHCDHVHPRDGVVCNRSSLDRHCMACGAAVPCDSVSATDGRFVHCNIVQTRNELYPFRCECDVAVGASMHSHPLQTGYSCRYCSQLRPELRQAAVSGGSLSAPPYYVWRCLREVGDDFHLCGAWNYSWESSCVACRGGRVMSSSECRARAEPWECSVCHRQNSPTSVILCAHCGSGVHPIQPCLLCGSPHLTLTCH